VNLTRRDFALGSAAALTLDAIAGSGATAATQIGFVANEIDPLDCVDPELRGALQEIMKKYPPTEWTEKTLPQMRQMGASFAQPALPTPPIAERKVPGAHGAPAVRIYVIGASKGAAPRPAVLHIHGGGYVSGTAAGALRPMQELSSSHDCLVVTVDYRLAPETRFPGALEDNYAALRWLYSHADELGVDRKRIALLGESAGGGHAATLAIAARDRGEVPVALQVLIYPMLDDRTGSTRMVPSHIGAFVWTADANRFGWSELLGVPAGSVTVPRGSVPARVENLGGLAPTFIGTGSVDLFVQENIVYAQRLVEAGVPTELYVAPGGFHGFDVIVPDAKISQRFTAAWKEALKRGLVS
jgi:acetyl esterase/lipase